MSYPPPHGHQGPPAQYSHAPMPVAPVQVAPVRTTEAAVRRGGGVITAWILLGVAALVMAGFLLLAVGPAATVVSGLLGLIPLAICLVGLRWVDRWDPEPARWVILALLWGGGAATFGSLIIEGLVGAALNLGETASAVVLAPVVEEVMKGLGVLLLVLVARRYFHGPVDGIVYGGLIGAGLAFTENILYLSSALQDGSVLQTWVGRGLLGPFAHVLFTAWTGAAVGWATERRRGLIFPAWLGGLVLAILGHALWNGLASNLLFGNFLVGYAVLQVPFFVGAVITCVLLARRERRLTKDSLQAYTQAGWYLPQEAVALSTPAMRRESLRWAAKRGARPQMRSVIRTADALAAEHQRIRARGPEPELLSHQAELLQRSLSARESLRGAVAHGPGGWTAS